MLTIVVFLLVYRIENSSHKFLNFLTKYLLIVLLDVVIRVFRFSRVSLNTPKSSSITL